VRGAAQRHKSGKPEGFISSPSARPAALRAQSSARTPKPVSLGSPSRISTKPKSMSAARSFSLTGDIFVRLPLISRIAQRRRIPVSRSSPANNDFACSARSTASSTSVVRQLRGLEQRGPLRLVGRRKLPARDQYWSKLVEARGISPQEHCPTREVYPHPFFGLQPQIYKPSGLGLNCQYPQSLHNRAKANEYHQQL
jgi:hypothetical protein